MNRLWPGLVFVVTGVIITGVIITGITAIRVTVGMSVAIGMPVAVCLVGVTDRADIPLAVSFERRSFRCTIGGAHFHFVEQIFGAAMQIIYFLPCNIRQLEVEDRI